ncbi:MAG: ABC transporter permease [Treponema sp.]|nr:ABC transporter permease [Treponema sp.]
MKISFLSAKLNIFCAAVFLLTVLALFAIAFLAHNGGKRNLLLVTSSQTGSHGINVNRIEEFTESDFLLTYEILSTEKVSLSYADFSVTLVRTNSCYPQIINYSLSEGAFFSKQAWTGAQRHAVLNETAANSIFGSVKIAGSQFKIRGETWIVTGVIDDGDKKSNRVYVPSSMADGYAYNFLVLTAGFDETLIKNSMKNLGIHDTNYDFFTLDTIINLLFERPQIMLYFLFCFIFIYIFIILTEKLKIAAAEFKSKLNKHYFKQLFLENQKTAFKPVWLASLLVLCPILTLFLLLHSVSIILPWQDIASLKGKQELFFPLVERLYNFNQASGFLFVFSLIFLCFSVIVFIRRK